MYNSISVENNSLNALKNNIEIIKLKCLIDETSYNKELKNEMNNYLFHVNAKNDFEFNNMVLNNDLEFNTFIHHLRKTILDFDSSKDINEFKYILNSKTNNYYKSVQKPNKFKFIKSIDNLYIKNGVRYIQDYVVMNNRDGDRDSILSQELWEYKEKKWHFDYFTDMLMRGIAYLSNNIVDDKIENICLVPIPRSTEGFISSVQKSVDVIESYYDMGITEFEYGCQKKIINLNGSLIRIESVDKSSEGGDPTKEDHERTIFLETKLIEDSDNTAFILLDDIVTYGTIMRACTNILTTRGKINRNKIYKLAIGGTRRW